MKTLLLTMLCLAGAAWAQTGDADLRRCRGIADAALRLACYDALPLAPPAPTPAVGPVGAAPAPGAPAVAATAAPAAPAARAAPVAAPAAAEAAFGLRRSSEDLQEIRSYIPGRFDGWSRNTRIRLANGQLWLVIDDGRASYDNLQDVKVRIHRAMLGSFLMEFEGLSGTPRVRRIE
jgi:hypothetical protein